MNRRSIIISVMGLAIAGLVSCQLFDRESLTAPAGGDAAAEFHYRPGRNCGMGRLLHDAQTVFRH